MQKYRLYEQIVKTKCCTFYRAQNTPTREVLIIKKLHRQKTWEQVLKNKNISLMSQPKIKYLSSIREVAKDESSFYCVMEPMEENLENVILGDLSKEDIYKISRNLIQMICHFHEHKVIPRQLRPAYFFISTNKMNLKLAHIQVTSKDMTQLDLAELQDLKYMSPEQVFTSRPIDERSTIFCVGLLIAELFIGQPLLRANTKINYMYELCQLFPDEKIEGNHSSKKMEMVATEDSKKQSDKSSVSFDKLMSQLSLSNEFTGFLRQMMRLDQSQRIGMHDLLQRYNLIVQDQQRFDRQKIARDDQAKMTIKANLSQAPISKQILHCEIQLNFQKKPTFSAFPIIKEVNPCLPEEQNVDDDTTQPIIIKQSAKKNNSNKQLIRKRNKMSGESSLPAVIHRGVGNPFGPTVSSGMTGTISKVLDSASQAVDSTSKVLESGIKMDDNGQQQVQPSLVTVRRPQLTNYALNDANLGVKLGFHPALFTDNENDD